MFPLCPPGGERGQLWGRCPPSRPLSTPPNHPPYLALRLCVHCPPVPTKASLSEQAGAHIHPRMGGGMKSGQGILLRAYPGPPPEGLPGCGHNLRNPKPSAGPYGGKGENEAFSLVAPPCDPVATSPSVPKAKLLLEHEDAGRTGRRSTLKGKGDSGGGCKEGPRGGNRRFPTTGPSLAPYRRTGIKRKSPDVPPHFYRRRALPASLFLAGTTGIFPFSLLLFMTLPPVPSGRWKGASYGGVAPLRGPFPPPESPPVPRAEALCSLPACSNQSFAFGTGGRTHPSPYAGRHEVRTRELPFRVYPGPPPEGLPGAGAT